MVADFCHRDIHLIKSKTVCYYLTLSLINTILRNFRIILLNYLNTKYCLLVPSTASDIFTYGNRISSIFRVVR